jgi:hypothetical protein
MKSIAITCSLLLALPGAAAAQLAGQPFIHDPSTIAESNGKYYTFGTGKNGLVSDDGWTWRPGGIRTGGGVAPDIIHIGGRYYVAYAVGGGGMNGGHASDVKIMWTKTLDPNSPDFGYHDVGTVASSNGQENQDAIDPAFLLAEGKLWLSYGTYFGSIRIPPPASASPAISRWMSRSTWRRPPSSIATAIIICSARMAPAATAPIPPTTSGSAVRAARPAPISTIWASRC